jgi:hypothetical protein
MSSTRFGVYIEVEPSSDKAVSPEFPLIPVAPKKAVPHNYHSVPQEPPDAIELDNLQWGQRLSGPPESGEAIPSGVHTPLTPNDLEMSRSSSPTHEIGGFEAMQSFSNPPMNKYRMLSVCLVSLAMGMNDSAPGALIPYIES